MALKVEQARAFAQSLLAAAQKAEDAGESEFELIETLQSVDDDARAELQAAIDAQRAANS